MTGLRILRKLASPIWLVLLLVSNFGSNLALAANPYAECVIRWLNDSFSDLQQAKGSATKIEISTWERGVPPRMVKQVHHWVQEVNSHLGNLTPPEFILLDINPHGVIAEATPEGNINISAFFGKGLQELKTTSERANQIIQKATKPAFQHEYGHQVFKANIWKYSPSYQQSLNLESTKRLKVLLAERASVRKKWKSLVKINQTKSWLLSERPDLKQKLNELNARLKSLGKEIDNLSIKIDSEVDDHEFVGGTRAYDELFADTIAIIAAKDPKAISKVLSDADRDFSVDHSIKGWKKSDIHTAYSPVRSYLYQNYLKNPETMDHPEHLLESLLKAIGERIEIQKQVQEKDLSLEELNARLIASFEKIMKADSKIR